MPVFVRFVDIDSLTVILIVIYGVSRLHGSVWSLRG